MTRKFAVGQDKWQPISTAPTKPETVWGIDAYDPETQRFAHAYMMRRGHMDPTEWFCGLARVYPAFWQPLITDDAA